VYLELETEEGVPAGPAIDMAFLCYEEDGVSAYVWAEKGGRLEKRPVTLGEVDPMTGAVQILEGLSAEDYIAFPDETLCQVGAATTRKIAAEETQPAEGGVA
jgi:HlyD family secretion protein